MTLQRPPLIAGTPVLLARVLLISPACMHLTPAQIWNVGTSHPDTSHAMSRAFPRGRDVAIRVGNALILYAGRTIRIPDGRLAHIEPGTNQNAGRYRLAIHD
jgi:hypothetical protein